MTTNTGTSLAPVGGTIENITPGEPNNFTDAQLEEFKEQDRYLPVSGCMDREGIPRTNELTISYELRLRT